jgi:hypothetical protein
MAINNYFTNMLDNKSYIDEYSLNYDYDEEFNEYFDQSPEYIDYENDIEDNHHDIRDDYSYSQYTYDFINKEHQWDLEQELFNNLYPDPAHDINLCHLTNKFNLD